MIDFLKKIDEFTTLHPEDSKKPLKLSKEEIGRHTWALMHSVAAIYPSIPTEENKKEVEIFLHSLSKVYPCKICAAHFKQMLQDFPIKHNSREEFVFYLCGLHNKVNERLGKKIYNCKQAFDIWGSDCGCEVSE
jgi:FAD-linked sulfhydryl oxidase